MTVSRSRVARRTTALATAVASLIAVVLGLSGASPAFASGGASISGTVYGQGSPSKPLADVQVTLELPGGDFVTTEQVGASGRYSFTGLPPANYILLYSLPVYPAPYKPQFWGNVSSRSAARVLKLAKGEAATVNMTLPKLAESASISGTVVDQDGDPVSGASVNINDGTGYGVQYSATTNSDGTYQLPGLIADTYTLDVQPSDGVNLAIATYPGNIVLGAGQALNGVNLTMETGATISGTVTEANAPGTPLGDGQVILEDSNNDSVAQGQVNDDGTYSIIGAPAGSYTLEFQPPFGSQYPIAYWQGESSFATAHFFTVSGGDELTGYDAAVPVGATISGTVMTAGANPQPVTDETIFAQNTSEDVSMDGSEATAFSGDDGTYTLIGLQPGSYTIEFQSDGSTSANQWWNNASTIGAAALVTVTTGQDRTGIDASVVPAASISGRVFGKAPSGSVFSADNAQVAVELPDGTPVTTAYSDDSQGDYTIPDLAAGQLSPRVHSGA